MGCIEATYRVQSTQQPDYPAEGLVLLEEKVRLSESLA